jgi:hypothetical protein
MLVIGRDDFQSVPSHTEGTRFEFDIVTFVLCLDELSKHGIATVQPTDVEIDNDTAIGFRITNAVDARDGGDNDNVLPGDDRRGCGKSQALDLFVDVGLFLDVEVMLGNIRLRLVVVVVGDEVFHGVFREEFLEFSEELGGQGFIVRQDESRSLRISNDIRNGECFSCAGGAQQDLMPVPPLKAFHKLYDRFRLITHRLIGRVKSEFWHLLSHTD